MTALVSLLFIAMIPIDCKITLFPYTCNINNKLMSKVATLQQK